MTKAELVDHVAATVQLPKSQTDAVLTQFMQAIIDALQAGESVDLRGFGRFQLRHRPARTGRNPRTGEAIPLSAVENWVKSWGTANELPPPKPCKSSS